MYDHCASLSLDDRLYRDSAKMLALSGAEMRVDDTVAVRSSS